MRKAQKQEILEIVKSLGLAHEEIKEELNRCKRLHFENAQKIQNMLGECQEFAISLGENIEKSEGEGHAAVAAIESYCEMLYNVHEEVSNKAYEGAGYNTNGEVDNKIHEETVNGAYEKDGRVDGSINENGIYKMLKKQLIEIENRIKNDIIAREEIVFLPYKASMWDSMESVWMEARDDEYNDTYVIPVPYYERNRDQSLGNMHYEGDEYPDYVPITDWQSYAIEERRPDVIYIQNPYDDCNFVTCVHPRYFSRELKKYTDMLVYLPYFVGVGDYVEEHFCTMPGVMNADKVFVQSEAVKKIYIKNIRKFEKENHCEGRFGDLNRKIVSSKSPKLDRIKRVIESGKLEIPEEWKVKIYSSTGKRKKVILYNTTIAAFLKYSETYIGKLKSVLDLFRQEKEFVLLWRPHPLLENTIKSMRPDFYAEYMEVVRTYREENWGIYDETADIDRAIILSDAYFGDWSSVVEMYKLTKKPIMIQNCEMLSI